MADKPKQQMRLQELFKSGELVTLEFMNPSDVSESVEVELWIRRPTPEQQQEAMAKAQAKKARLRRDLKDPDSDAHLALVAEVSEIEGRNEVIDQLVRFEEQNLRSTAINDILYDPEVGSDWGKEGSGYHELIDAISQRWDEIIKYNEELSVDDEEMRIDFQEDEELGKLNAEQEKFQTEVEARLEEYLTEEKAKYKGKKIADLRDELIKKLIDIQSGLEWYQEYRTNLLFYGVREPQDKKKLYFRSIEELAGMPDYVQSKLFAEYDRIDRGADEVKNLLSPPRS